MKLKLIVALLTVTFAASSAMAQCSSGGSTWVGDNARNITPGAAGSTGGGSSGGSSGGLGGMMGGSSGNSGGFGGGSLGGWSGGSMGGSGSGSSSGGGFMDTIGLGSVGTDKSFTLSDAAKLTSTATTAYGIAKGDSKVTAAGAAGLIASNKFSGSIDNFGSGVAKSAGNVFSSGSSSSSSGACDAEFGCAGAYDKAVASQSSGSGLGSVFNSGSGSNGSSSNSSFNISGNEVKQYSALAGMAMTVSGNGQSGQQVAQLGQLAGSSMNTSQQSNGQMNGQSVQQYSALAGQAMTMSGNGQSGQQVSQLGNIGGQVMNTSSSYNSSAQTGTAGYGNNYVWANPNAPAGSREAGYPVSQQYIQNSSAANANTTTTNTSNNGPVQYVGRTQAFDSLSSVSQPYENQSVQLPDNTRYTYTSGNWVKQ